MTQEINKPLEEALNLLISWNLPQLCQYFREQEVCINAFHCLTEHDIVQLVPKIGPRAIFSTRLKEWLDRNNRLTKRHNNDTHQQQQQHFANSDHQFTDLLGAVKLEIKESETNWSNDPNEIRTNSMALDVVPEPTTITEKHNENHVETVESHLPTLNQKLNINNVHTQIFVNVRDILTNNFYGLKAMEYYDNHHSLDAVQRKKIVEIIISTVMEQHVVMSSQCFTDLAQQLINIFPNESIETYYTPRIGLTCPKGALYNKYLNMGKAMRRSGLLEYRVGRRARHNPMCPK